MESLLERGEKLDDLVQKSEHLGNQSKAFYKTVSLVLLRGHAHFFLLSHSGGLRPQFLCGPLGIAHHEIELGMYNGEEMYTFCAAFN